MLRKYEVLEVSSEGTTVQVQKKGTALRFMYAENVFDVIYPSLMILMLEWLDAIVVCFIRKKVAFILSSAEGSDVMPRAFFDERE